MVVGRVGAHLAGVKAHLCRLLTLQLWAALGLGLPTHKKGVMQQGLPRATISMTGFNPYTGRSKPR